MKRGHFIWTGLLGFPLVLWGRTLWAGLQSLTKAFVTRAGESRHGDGVQMKGVASNRIDVKVSGQDTDGAQAILEMTGLTYRGGPPLHVHHNQDQIFYILEGRFRVQVGEELFTIQAGDTIFLPRGVPHTHLQLTEKARMISVFQPAGKAEQFFKATAALPAKPGKDEVARVYEQHEMKVVGPPLKAD